MRGVVRRFCGVAVLDRVAAFLTAATLGWTPAAAQGVGERPGAVRVFLDCAACDAAHIRREITYVNWVRDRADADVHVLGTEQAAGPGGVRYELTFLGLRRFAGRADTLRYLSTPTDTRDERRAGLVHTLQLGLVRFVAATPLAPQVRITFIPTDPRTAPLPGRDPWNAWVFTTGLSAFFNGEERQSALLLAGSLAADRTTEAHKFAIALTGSYYRDRFTFQISDTTGASRDTTIVSTQRNYGGSLLAVWSLGAHWSAGGRLTGESSTFLNRDWAIEAGPAVEYSVFPYVESTRRRLTVLYSIGGYAADYEEETVFDQTGEALPLHTLEVVLRYQQPWGSTSARVAGSQFLHDLSKHRVSVAGSASLRLMRGVSLTLGGNVARIKDQIDLSKAGLTPDEIFLRRRQLGTNYRYSTNLSLSYRFGSAVSNIVNPRMGNP